MSTFFSTDLLQRLRWKHLLKSRLDWLDLPFEPIFKWLVELNRLSKATPSPSVYSGTLGRLQKWGLITDQTPTDPSPRALPLPFVTTVNFELTYDCPLSCSHCLQQNLRNRLSGTWLSTEAAKRSITEAWFAGLLTIGINFTGGEIIDPKSNLPELLETTKALKLPFRLNTNGTWGDKKNIAVGTKRFSNARHLINWLRRMGMEILALSYDDRYKQYPQLWPPLLSLIRECERVGQDYQLVATGDDHGSVDDIWKRVLHDANIVPKRMGVVTMTMVDIGGAVKKTGTPLRFHQLDFAQSCPPCQWLGFHRPYLLHIGPHGGVRTCMYAPGASTLGNIASESLLDIINRSNSNPVMRFFQRDSFESFVDKYMVPYTDLSTNVDHSCTLSALLVRIVEEVEKFKSQRGTEPAPEDLRRIHSFVAKDFNIQVNAEVFADGAHSTSGRFNL